MGNNRAAVFVLLGQSNAVGHAIPMEETDKICTPLKNVFGLKRETNQSFDNNGLYWSGYTSGEMNLAEEQDHTYSVANCLAKLWQDEIDNGNKHNLPDLYIVHIAIGAQGVTKGYMWNPDYERKIIPGILGTVKISLYPFTTHILSMVKKSLRHLRLSNWMAKYLSRRCTNMHLAEIKLAIRTKCLKIKKAMHISSI